MAACCFARFFSGASASYRGVAPCLFSSSSVIIRQFPLLLVIIVKKRPIQLCRVTFAILFVTFRGLRSVFYGSKFKVSSLSKTLRPFILVLTRHKRAMRPFRLYFFECSPKCIDFVVLFILLVLIHGSSSYALR